MEMNMTDALNWLGDVSNVAYVRVFPYGAQGTVMVEIFRQTFNDGHDAVRVNGVNRGEFEQLFQKMKKV